jgi:hypothetical protein
MTFCTDCSSPPRQLGRCLNGPPRAIVAEELGWIFMVDNFDLTNLLSPATKRWVARRKALVVQAVRSGSISLEDACRRFKLSIEEFHGWHRAIDRVPGLRVTRLQIYRETDRARLPAK